MSSFRVPEVLYWYCAFHLLKAHHKPFTLQESIQRIFNKEKLIASHKRCVSLTEFRNSSVGCTDNTLIPTIYLDSGTGLIAALAGRLATSGSAIKPQCTPNNNAAPPGDINPHHQHYHYQIMAVDAFWIKKRQIWIFFAANSYIWIQIELMICKDSCGTSKLIDFAVDPIMQLWLW